MFTLVSTDKSGIDFSNIITENDSINILDEEYVYNGGGVGIGDFNNDELPDIYFTGNMVSNKLYLNKGDFRFSDITVSAAVTGEGKWCSGVSIVDINNDGWQDIYVCATIYPDSARRANLLYVNQHLDKNGMPFFKEMAAQYGLNDNGNSTSASFFDYDNDGDLDVYVLTDVIGDDVPSKYRLVHTDGSYPNTDRLYRNDWSDSLQHPFFTNISKQAGITWEGYGLGVNVCDINRDGWKDIYVSNDYVSNNLLYINNKNGTFTNEFGTYFKHSSSNAMGNDIADINNDGLMDVVELDMAPEDNYRRKLVMNSNSYNIYQLNDYYGYTYQYVRNCVQLNNGPRLQNDTLGAPIFSEIGFYTGMAETDWSWAPSVVDFDNNGFRDLLVTNGFPKDITDHDFIAFRSGSYFALPKQELLGSLKSAKVHNYAFKNEGALKFTDVSDSWGMSKPSFSNGAAYADLDKDGDLDYIVNNINDKAFLYKNNLNEKEQLSKNYLRVAFLGYPENKDGIGTFVELHYNNGQKQIYEHNPYRGYISSVEKIAHFGLGAVTEVDSIAITWQTGNKEILRNIKANQLLKVYEKNASVPEQVKKNDSTSSLFSDVTLKMGVQYTHSEKDFIDFNNQRLLPHKLSQYGPSLSVGDVDGNGLDDIFIGGTEKNCGRFLMQQASGRFIEKRLLQDSLLQTSEDMGALLFDVDGDKDLDLYITSGSNEKTANTAYYQDRLYRNSGKGDFIYDSLALPQNFTSKSCIRASDFDKDGDMDLFAGGRIMPGKFPMPVSSFIFRNDTKNGTVKFTDVTKEIAADLMNIGMICDALWTDTNNDGWMDLLLAGEWMPPTILKNDKGILKRVKSPLDIHKGWFNSLCAGDFDNDGDMDYMAGNLGQNSYYKASPDYPARLYVDDFDENGSLDAIPVLYKLSKFNTDGTKNKLGQFTAHNRDDVIEQLTAFKKRFLNYESFASIDFNQLITKEQQKKALIFEATQFSSCFIRNDGNDSFEVVPLPWQAQISSLYSMVPEDVNGDGNLDVIITGNDFGTEPSLGRYDALNGLMLLGNGKGDFSSCSLQQSGIFIPGDGKALVKLRIPNNRYLIAASQNRQPLKIFASNSNLQIIDLLPTDNYAMVTLLSGRKRKEEFYYGSSFLSQSGRFLTINENVKLVEIFSLSGKSRLLPNK